MMTFVPNEESLKQAVKLLLDKKYGLSRIQKVRERISALPKSSRAFAGATAPLNYLHEMALSDAVTVLKVLDLSEKQYSILWNKVASMDKSATKLAELRKENSRLYHERVRQSIMAEGIRRNHRLSTKEIAEHLAREKERWAKLTKNYKIAHPELTGRELMKAAKNSINKRVTAELQAALNERHSYKRPSPRDLEFLEKKFNRK